MATKKTTVSVYADDELFKALEKFRDDEKHKSLNVAIVAILREKLFGEVSDNLQSTLQSKVSSTLDIEAMIAAAIDAKIEGFKASVNSEFIDIKQAITSATDIEATVSNEIAPLLARLEALETNLSEASASAKKPVIDSPIQSDALPIIEAIEALPAPHVLPSDEADTAAPESLELNQRQICDRFNIDYKNLSKKAGNVNLTSDAYIMHIAKEHGEIWNKAAPKGSTKLWKLVKTLTP